MGRLFVFRQTGAVGVHAVLLALTLLLFAPEGPAALFHPATGWALAVVLMRGRGRMPGLSAASLLVYTIATQDFWFACGLTLAQAAGVLSAHALLTRRASFDLRLSTLKDYRRLLLAGVLPLTLVGTLAALPVLAARTPNELALPNGLLWGMGEALGALIVTPLALLLRHGLPRPGKGRWPEVILIAVLIGLIDHAIFHEGFGGGLSAPIYKAWLLPPLIWITIRMGRRYLALILTLIATQSMGAIHGQLQPELLNDWVYVTLVSIMSTLMAFVVHELHRASDELRIAATAFECQEGMIVTDAERRILRVNRSFTDIMGYTEAEVLGRRTTFMRSDRHPDSFWEEAWNIARTQGRWSDEVWHRRKNGEVFPQWLTATVVRNTRGEITNYIVTHTDISARKQREAEILQLQQTQRDALVREVHHRIKNNLQGIVSLLRRFANSHPEVAPALNQAIGQVGSIAVIHGLQGRRMERTVRLCELTREVVLDLSRIWSTPVRLDIPFNWTPCLIADHEAVPLALAIHELILNAIKHGRQHTAGVSVTMRKGAQPDHVDLRITNSGIWPAQTNAGNTPAGDGLRLVASILPRKGALLSHREEDGMIHVLLQLAPPVITLETRSDPHAKPQFETAAG